MRESKYPIVPLSTILDRHRQEYNTMAIKSNLHIEEREASLNAIDSYTFLQHMDDAELRDSLIPIFSDLTKMYREAPRGSMERLHAAFELKYWHELTDELKHVIIKAEDGRQGRSSC